jgi:hypothetical protein
VPERSLADRSIFLNFPFNRSYERVFLGIVAGLISLKLTPRCVVEVPDHGQGRMGRLYELIKSCRASIHDLSCVGVPARFNMPFELGIAYTLKQADDSYQFVIFEKVRYRFERNLTDLKMIDSKIHGGSGRRAMQCVYQCFVPNGQAEPAELGAKIFWHLSRRCRAIRGRNEHIFNRSSYYQVMTEASLIATAPSS